MKKALDIFLIIIFFFIIYFLQSNFFTWFNITKIMPNLFVILIAIIGLFINKEYGMVFGAILGLFLDFFIGTRIGINGLTYAVIGYLAGVIDKNFSKDNKLTLMSIVFFLTAFTEVIICFLQILFLKIQINTLIFIKIVLIECIFNSIIVIIMYPLIVMFGNKIANDFIKNNNFLNFLH